MQIWNTLTCTASNALTSHRFNGENSVTISRIKRCMFLAGMSRFVIYSPLFNLHERFSVSK